MKGELKGIRCVAREKIDSFTEEGWKRLEEDDKRVNTVSIREVVFGSATFKDCT